MRRFGMLLATMVAATSLAGCGGQSEPQPLDPEQRRQIEQRLQEIDEEERVHFEQTQP